MDARRTTEACGMRPRGKTIGVGLGATGALLPDASNLLSCSKADAFTRCKRKATAFEERLPDFVMP